MPDVTPADRYAQMPPAKEAVIRNADGTFSRMVGTTNQKFHDGFMGSALDPAKWDIVRNVGAMTIAIAAGQMTVALGTASGDELLLVGKTNCTNPASMQVGLKFSQKIVNQLVSFGFVEVDPDTGVPIPHATLTTFPAEFSNSARKTFSGSSTTSGFLEACYNDTTLASVTDVSTSATSAFGDYTLLLRPEDVTSASAPSDSTAAKTAAGARLSSVVPAMGRVYRPFIWFRNTGVPASSTNVFINRVLMTDISEIEAQVTTGGGVATPSAGVPAQIVNVASGSSAGNVPIQGGSLHGGSSVEAPINLGGTTQGALQTAVVTGRKTNTTHDLSGRLVISPGGIPAAHTPGRAVLSTTSETTLVASTALQRHEMFHLTLANRDTVEHTIDLRDATSGTIRDTFIIAPKDTLTVDWSAGYPAAAIAQNWTVQMREAQTTAGVECSSSGYNTTA